MYGEVKKLAAIGVQILLAQIVAYNVDYYIMKLKIINHRVSLP